MNVPNNNLYSELDPEQNLTYEPVNCRYFSISDFSAEFSNHSFKSNFSILNQNIQSFHAKKTKLEAFMASLNYDFKSLVLTETWNHANIVDLCKLDNYSAVHTYRSAAAAHRGSVGGGVSVFVDSKIYSIKKFSELSVCTDHIELCVANVRRMDGGQCDGFIIIGVYRPPGGNIPDFLVALEELFSHRSLLGKLIVVSGDMNLNISDQNLTAVQNYLSLLNSFSFLPAITKPTRFAANNNSNSITATTLDHIFVNKVLPFHSGVFTYDLSDHCGSMVIFKAGSDVEIGHTKVSFRPYSEQSFQSLVAVLNGTCWDILLACPDVNNQLNVFCDYVNKAYCNCFPIKSKLISHKRVGKPWITEQTLSKIRLKSQLFIMYKNNEITKQCHNRLRNRLNKDIELDKKHYYNTLFREAKHNIKKTWLNINYLLGSNNKKSSESFLGKTNNICEKLEILEKFNDFFANVGEHLASELDYTSTSPTENFNFLPNSFYLFPVRDSEIVAIVSGLKNTKTNIDELPVRLFQKLIHCLKYPLSKLLNMSFMYGVFPERLKIAKITPIHKEGDPTSPSNFRPISSLNYVSKIYEKLMAKRIFSFCRKFSIISENQFGFQSGLSTTDALIKLTEDIYHSFNQKLHNFTILIDIKKAFDSVNHEILLKKLNFYGIRGIPLRWLSSYLSDRKCFIEFDSVKSSLRNFNVGVPQGSILGPLLFLLYVNCIPKISDAFNAILYADDTTITMRHQDIAHLTNNANVELKKIVDWTLCNKLTLNSSKTDLILFSNRILNTEAISVRLEESILTPKFSVKYLGVAIDNRMNFKDHVNMIISKISKHTGILYRLKSLFPTKTRLDYYYAFIFPYLTYNIIIWGGTCQSVLLPLITLHKRIIRMIADAGYRDHSDPLFKRLGLLKLTDLYNFNLLVYMQKARSKGTFTPRHSFETRNRLAPASEFHRLSKCQQAVSFAGPAAWNRLPVRLKELENLNKFKKTVKSFLIDKYED